MTEYEHAPGDPRPSEAAISPDGPCEISVRRTADGTVTLEGWVSSFADHQKALDEAQAAPGARSVVDLLMILTHRS